MMTAQTVIEAFPTLRRVCHSAALTSFANSEEARIYGLRVFGVHQMDFTVVAGCKPCLGLLSTFPRGNAVTGHCLADDVIIKPNFTLEVSWKIVRENYIFLHAMHDTRCHASQYAEDPKA